MQVPGVDFTEYFLPVAKDSTIRTAFTLVLKERDWECISVDVEAEFLNPHLKRVVYLEWPDGMVELGYITQEEKEKYCIMLVQSMHGNVDAAMLWMQQFTQTVTKYMEYRLTQSRVDP